MLSSRSVNCSSDTLRASLTLRRSPLPPTPHPRLLTGSTCTYALHHATSAPKEQPHPQSLTSLTPHPSPFRSPVALLSYHPNPTHDSGAPMGACGERGAVERRASGVCVGEVSTAISVPSATEQHPSALTGATVSLCTTSPRVHWIGAGEESDTKYDLRVRPELSLTVGRLT
jgi:hypothetical protein